MEAAAIPVDSSYMSHTPSDKPTWRAIHKLEFGAKPEKRNRREWICGLECKKNKEVVTFKDAQAAEKHIMREHPDPVYNKFVCLKDGCGKEKVSPQQILDHLGQKIEKRGHNITAKIDKDENLRAVKKRTGKKFRYAEGKQCFDDPLFRVFRDKNSFAWYICVPNEPSAATFVKDCASPVMPFTFEEEFQVITMMRIRTRSGGKESTRK